VPVADVERIVQERLVVGPHVEADGDHAIGIDAGGGGVDRELADRDGEAVDAPVADPQDRLGVGRHQQIDVSGLEPVVAQRRLDALDVVDRKVDAVRPLVLAAVALDRLRHHRVVHDRQHLLEVIREELVVQDLVAVAQRREEPVLRQIGRLGGVLLVRAHRLLLEREHP
jgi:hypothetical protein